jgi:hypothetical protein
MIKHYIFNLQIYTNIFNIFQCLMKFVNKKIFVDSLALRKYNKELRNIDLKV